MSRRVIERLKKHALKASTEEELLAGLCRFLDDRKDILGVGVIYRDREDMRMVQHCCQKGESGFCDRVKDLCEKVMNCRTPVVESLEQGAFVHVYPLISRWGCFGCIAFMSSVDRLEGIEEFVESVAHIFSIVVLRRLILSNPSVVSEIFSLMDEAIWVVDSEGYVLDANPAVEALFGVPIVEFLGSRCEDLERDGYLPGICSLMRVAESEGRASAVESAAGMIYSVNVYRVPFEGEGYIFVFVAREITKHVKYQMQMIQADRARNLERITMGLSHEINNPLTAVVGFASVLLEMEKDESKRELLKRIKMEAEKCTAVIKGLSALAPSAYSDFTVVDVNQLVRNLVSLKESYYRLQGIRLELDLDEGIPVVTTIPAAVYEAVGNIITNAEDAVLKNKGERLIRISTGSDGDWVFIRVEDNGPGVPTEIVDKIFDPFFTTKPKGEGTGVGLAIAKEALSSVGGEVEVGSGNTGGASFVVKLPVSHTLSNMVDDTSLVGERIIILTGERMVADMLRLFLSRKGATVLLVDSLEQFKRIVKEKGPFSRVVINEPLEGMSVVDTVREIVDFNPFFKGRMLFLTSLPLGVEEGMYLKFTGCRVLVKPFTEKELMRELVFHNEADSVS